MIIFNNQSHKKIKINKKKLKTQLNPINQNRVLKNTKLYQAEIGIQEK